ncbi:MAG TPA: protein kinase [Kofleriaceae bacterium]|nr:protein kinase [Kofleriaceae bacterium]
MSTDEETLVAPPTGDEESGERVERAERSEPAPSPDGEPAPRPLLASRYQLGRRIGRGGMGEVMTARDLQVGREVAIKRLRAAAPGAQAIRRFLREASIQGRLEHPAIVPVHEIGHDGDGLPFFVMKKLTGTTLGRAMSDPELATSFPRKRVLRAFAEVCLAVELAHVRGIVHRDLKPDNILLGDFGEVYILDWGVAKVFGEDEGEGEFTDVGSGSGEHATTVGTTIGTPGYMSPEQVCGMPDVDGRADIYALGCVLFEILAGEPLHPRTRDAAGSGAWSGDARPSRRAPGRGIAPELDELCVAATAADRQDRIQSARELGDRVQRYLDGDRDLALRRGLARAHFERAQAAFGDGSGGSDQLRRTAMREAAAALALDPALDGAAALVGRLMLDPPRTTPREVDEAIAADEVRTVKDNARAGLWALIACLAFTPLLWWIAPHASGYVAAFTGMMVMSGGFYFYAYHGASPRPGLVIIGNAVVIALLARMFSPLLIAPGVAAVLAMAMVLTPRLSVLGSASAVAALFITAAIAPTVLERIGVLSRTISIDSAGILLRAPAVAGAEGPSILVGTLYTIGLIIGSCGMAHAMRARTRAAHRHLHVQAWQLRQLVPR